MPWRGRRSSRRARRLAQSGRHRLSRSGQNLPRPGSRRSGTRRNRDAARSTSWRRERRGDRLPAGARQRRTQRSHGTRRSDRRFHRFFRGLGRSLNRGNRSGRRLRRGNRLRLASVPNLGRRFFVFLGLWSRPTARGFFHRGFAPQVPAHQQSLVVFERTGVSLLLGDAQFRKQVDDGVGLYFQLPGKLVDANFTHTMRLWRGSHTAPEFWISCSLVRLRLIQQATFQHFAIARHVLS